MLWGSNGRRNTTRSCSASCARRAPPRAPARERALDSLRGAMADIGTSLREARMRARIDITEVESATKIRARYLRAIENEEWDALPGPVYVKSFLRTYADYLGLDSRMLVEEFKRRYEHGGEHELSPIASLPRRERERQRERDRLGRSRFAPPPWVAIVLVLALVIAALAIVGIL